MQVLRGGYSAPLTEQLRSRASCFAAGPAVATETHASLRSRLSLRSCCREQSVFGSVVLRVGRVDRPARPARQSSGRSIKVQLLLRFALIACG